MSNENTINILIELRELISILIAAEYAYSDYIDKLIRLYLEIAKTSTAFKLYETNADIKGNYNLLTGELS